MIAGEGAVIAGVDGTGEADAALRWAAGEAALRKVRLHLVYAFAPLAGQEGAGLPVLRKAFAALERDGHRLLEEAVREVPADVPVTTEMASHPPVPVLLEHSKHARMIVLGAPDDTGLVSMLAGSTLSAVTAHARCPVVVVRGEGRDGPVVVGVAGAPASESAVAAAFDEVTWRGAALAAVHAVGEAEHAGPSPREQQAILGEERVVLSASLAGWREKYPDVRVDEIVVAGEPRKTLLDFSRQAQLVVVGTRGHGGFTGLLLGSTSHALIHHAHCPVMIIRSAPS
ncbi:MAG TPA: universal stress protein [Amycolatopsis sp.]|uniref:universal stress protein n=1 Tax=Amycolatopsis sp. TaxID=37632 RepID=UPI002B459E85|nr:universal stress protein [Amycolatopsis sp.]HKS43498.1 universal stress protein [Amycolatopsis sp.]